MSQEDTATAGQEPAPEATTTGTTDAKVTVTKTEGFADLSPATKDEIKSLRAEAAKYRTEAQEAKAKAQEYEEANQSELEKAQGKLTKAEQAKADAEAKLLRYEVGTSKEVPAKLFPLLTGASKEELEAQADLILENAKPSATPEFDGGARDPAPDPKTPEQAHNESLLAALGIPTNQ